jgi:L-ribulose-5-phosphate 3-epimerase
MRLGYNTNGMAHHDPVQAIELLAEVGYTSVAITVDQSTLNPLHDGWEKQAERIGEILTQFGMSSVIETGARYLLDPATKHWPTLLAAKESDRRRRREFLLHCIDVASRLGSDCVSLWSGSSDDQVAAEPGLERLAEGLQILLEHAEERSVDIGFEPEPGMFIENMTHFERLLQWVEHPRLKLTLDVGHLYCLGEVPIADYIHGWAARIVNVHIEDMRAGKHEHLMFGDGEMRFPPILDAFKSIDYRGGVHVELSRHSHMAPEAVRAAFEFLSPLMTANE